MWMILFQNASARSMQNRFRFVNVLARGRCKNEARWKADRRHLYCVRVSAIGRWHFWLVFNQIKRFANTTCFNVLFPFIYSWFLAFSFRLALIYLFLLSFLIRFFVFVLHSLTFPVLFSLVLILTHCSVPSLPLFQIFFSSFLHPFLSCTGFFFLAFSYLSFLSFLFLSFLLCNSTFCNFEIFSANNVGSKGKKHYFQPVNACLKKNEWNEYWLLQNKTLFTKWEQRARKNKRICSVCSDVWTTVGHICLSVGFDRHPVSFRKKKITRKSF